MTASRYSRYEVSVGAFVLAGIAAILYLSVSLGGLRLFKDGRYSVSARFATVGTLKSGDPVKLAGVDVGEVGAITLDDFQALAVFNIDQGVKLPSDTIASVQSAGLLGDSFVSLSPGANDDDLKPGDRIVRTESAVSLTELISKYAFGSPMDEAGGSAAPAKDAPTDDGNEPPKKVFSNPLE